MTWEVGKGKAEALPKRLSYSSKRILSALITQLLAECSQLNAALEEVLIFPEADLTASGGGTCQCGLNPLFYPYIKN